MSVRYTAISWTRQKKIYDLTLAALVGACLALFAGVTLAVHPGATAETVVIRATAVTALLVLQVVLCIGPLARLDRRFLPLLYNRRHLGVAVFLLALIHGVFAVVQFHALGDEHPLVSVFTAYARDYGALAHPAEVAHLPFEPLGVAALAILFLMAATSHDFWLRNLGASFWKLLHMGVYAAYGLVLAHVAFGALQSERSPVYPALLGAGFAVVAGLHLVAWRREARVDAERRPVGAAGFVRACAVAEVAEGRGTVVVAAGRRVALWRHQGRIFATSNVCRHQGGPLGEGRIVDGCITCPWHGWTYRPEDGCSPPPFAEVIETHEVRVVDGQVLVRAAANRLGARVAGAAATGAEGAAP